MFLASSFLLIGYQAQNSERVGRVGSGSASFVRRVGGLFVRLPFAVKTGKKREHRKNAEQCRICGVLQEKKTCPTRTRTEPLASKITPCK
jgi:hypothetical protein